MTTIPIILDTGPLIALLSERDDYHYWSLQQLADMKGPLITCEAVITEARVKKAHNTRTRYIIRNGA
jgi:uncharacterized protein